MEEDTLIKQHMRQTASLLQACSYLPGVKIISAPVSCVLTRNYTETGPLTADCRGGEYVLSIRRAGSIISHLSANGRCKCRMACHGSGGVVCWTNSMPSERRAALTVLCELSRRTEGQSRAGDWHHSAGERTTLDIHVGRREVMAHPVRT